MNAIEVRNVSKHYGRVQALSDVSFSVEKGEVFGLIGPDGAGKTTMFRILCSLLLPETGTATVDGFDVVRQMRDVRCRVGYMPGKFSLYQDLTVEENLTFFATLFGTTVAEGYDSIKAIYSQIERFKNRRAGALSGGMKQKLALSCALIHAPRVLFLDEPTTGVDPVSRKEFWEMLKRLKERHGLSIVASTPYMDEAMQCDRIALIQSGQFLTIDTPQGIIASYDRQLWGVHSDKMHQLLDDLRSWQWCDTAFSFGEQYHLTVKPGASQEALGRYLQERGHSQVSISAIEATIEDCFMALM